MIICSHPHDNYLSVFFVTCFEVQVSFAPRKPCLCSHDGAMRNSEYLEMDPELRTATGLQQPCGWKLGGNPVSQILDHINYTYLYIYIFICIYIYELPERGFFMQLIAK